MQEISILTARALATQRKFTAMADNIANANTDGYRRKDYEFKEVVSRPLGHPTASYVADRSMVIDYNAGVLAESGSPTNAAIAGKGFFAIDVNGETQYTRRGHFVVANDGTLMTPEGYPVLDIAQGPIQLPAGVRDIIIARDGTLATEQGQVAQIGVFEFQDDELQSLQRTGNVAFTAGGATPVPSANPTVIQGKIEASNVDPVKESVMLQDASRAYQTSLKLLQSSEQLQERAIRTLGGTQ
ncbi:MAG: flagellar hook-basal body complex protein [Alphaproteobacteria bacterium]